MVPPVGVAPPSAVAATANGGGSKPDGDNKGGIANAAGGGKQLTAEQEKRRKRLEAFRKRQEEKKKQKEQQQQQQVGQVAETASSTAAAAGVGLQPPLPPGPPPPSAFQQPTSPPPLAPASNLPPPPPPAPLPPQRPVFPPSSNQRHAVPSIPPPQPRAPHTSSTQKTPASLMPPPPAVAQQSARSISRTNAGAVTTTATTILSTKRRTPLKLSLGGGFSKKKKLKTALITNDEERKKQNTIVSVGITSMDDNDNEDDEGREKSNRPTLLTLDDLQGKTEKPNAATSAPPTVLPQQASLSLATPSANGHDGTTISIITTPPDTTSPAAGKKKKRGSRWDTGGPSKTAADATSASEKNITTASSGTGRTNTLETYMHQLKKQNPTEDDEDLEEDMNEEAWLKKQKALRRAKQKAVAAIATIKPKSELGMLGVDSGTTSRGNKEGGDADESSTASSAVVATAATSSMGKSSDEIMLELLKRQRDKKDGDEDTSIASGKGGGKKNVQFAADVKSAKEMREQRLKELEKEAEEARRKRFNEIDDVSGLYVEEEGGVMEEAERNLSAIKEDSFLGMGGPLAMLELAEINKKKELKAVNHDEMDYYPIVKNLYIVPRLLARLTDDEILNQRGKLSIKVRGKGCPSPITEFREAGLSEKILHLLAKQNIMKPFAIQCQCLPAIMAGRDVIGIAKTGSGKTLAYLLPLLRHVLAQQPPLQLGIESGPMALILAPARELATQIHHVAKFYCKHLGLKSTAVYGGGGVADQIGDLKRGCHVVVATPGRLIDLLTMQAGKLLSLSRVSFVVMDEADRMFDMGFAPQISAILGAIRPDRQTVLFSATFPKLVEKLARHSLRFPLEVLVGGRSVASNQITQYAELLEEPEKFLRLLQLLGEYVTDDDEEEEGKDIKTNKVIVFVDTQLKADQIFERLVKHGYTSVVSLHGGKDQEDRDSTISDFKRAKSPFKVLVATSVAGRGLDVPTCGLVINYSAPNHLEDYVHRVGRTGRGSAKGVAYTFVNSSEEQKYAPLVVRALNEAGQGENVQKELLELSDKFKASVKSGEARWAGSGYKGKGYSYDSSELSEAQKVAKLEKRQAMKEAGMLNEEEDADEAETAREMDETRGGGGGTGPSTQPQQQPQVELSAELLQLPGMQEAILRKSGMKVGADLDVMTGGLGEGVSNYVAQQDHYTCDFMINDYPQQARWKATQKDTTSRLQDECHTAVTLKGQYFMPGREPNVESGERKLHLHLEAQTLGNLRLCVFEIRRLLNEETLRVSGNASNNPHNASDRGPSSAVLAAAVGKTNASASSSSTRYQILM